MGGARYCPAIKKLLKHLSKKPMQIFAQLGYYNQGKYEQAAKWYEKVMRKEKLNIDQNKGISND
jgi:hypothetical protein